MVQGINIDPNAAPSVPDNLPAKPVDTSNVIPRLRNFIQQKGITPEVNTIITDLINSGVAKAQDFQVPNQEALSATDIVSKTGSSLVKGVANTGISLMELAGGIPDAAVTAAESLAPGVDLKKSLGIQEDILPTVTEDAQQARVAVENNLGFTPEQLQELPTPIAGTARGAQIAGESALPIGAAVGRGKVLLSRLGKDNVTTLGAVNRAFVDAARDPKKFIQLEAALSGASGVGGDLTAKNLGENSRVMGELSTAFGLPFAIGVARTLKNLTGSLFGLSEQRAQDLVGLAISKELQKNPDFARTLKESQALQEIVPGLKIDLVKGSRSPSFNKAKNAVEVDVSEMDIDNRRALAAFEKTLQDDIGVIRSQNVSQTGFPRTEALSAQAFKTQVGKVVDSELSAVDQSLHNLEQDFTQGIIPGSLGDKFTSGQEAFEKFIQIRGRADRTVKSVYNQIDPNLVLPRQSFKGMNRAYVRALRVDAAGNKAPAEVLDMVNKLKGSFKSGSREVIRTSQFDPTTLTQKTTRRLSPEDPRTNSFAALREMRSELGSKASEAARAGDRPLARRYNILMAEVNRTLDNAGASGGLPPDQASLLAEGNRLRRNFAKLFEDFEGRALFAKTNQAQMKMAFEDTLSTFIKPNTSKRAVSAIDNMKRLYGDSDETRDIVRNELLRRMQIVAEKDGVLNPVKVRKFANQYSGAINRAGLKDDFSTINKASQALEDNITAFGQSRKSIENSTLAHITKADDPAAFIEQSLKSREKFTQLVADAREAGPDAYKTFKASVMETLTNATMLKQLEAGTERVPVMSAKTLNEMLIVNGNEIKTLLGNQHFNKLKILQKALVRTDPKEARFIGGAAPPSTAEKTFTPITTALSLVRQIQQRVLSPQFVATNLTVNNVLALQSKVIRGVWEQAITDIDFATDLARAAQSKAEAPLVRSLFSPGFGLLGGPDAVTPQERNTQRQASQKALSERQFIDALRGTSP